jgi:sugar phosphate permease
MGMPIIASVANWFQKRRGLAFGLAWSGVGLGGLFVPLIGWMVDQFGWRDTALYIGIGLSIIGFPIAGVMRHQPEKYGYLPDGESPVRTGNKADAGIVANSGREGDFNAKEALRSSSFWFISLSIAARMLSSSGLALHMIPYLSGLGASTIGAATLAGSVSLMSIPGRFGLGLLSDYVNSRYLMAGCLATIAASFIFISKTATIAGTIPALMVYAVAQGGVAVIPQTMLADYFGRNSYATIQGLRGLIQMIGVVGGPILAGYIFDKTQSYKHAFELFAIATVISMVLMLMAIPPQKQKANTS